jgi:UDP-N-acetylglucosamine 1-carboxyvinyltransferase
MSTLLIRGGRPVGGFFRPFGNKNAALPMLAAATLTAETVRLENVPEIVDVENMLRILRDAGATAERKGHAVEICAKDLRRAPLSEELCGKVRGSILFAGPLAARFGEAVLPPPGGDVIGRRRLDTHFAGLEAMGAKTDLRDGRYRIRSRRGRLKGAEILLDEASVTATENLLLAATLAEGETVLYNAACEPHVQDLARLLVRMGAKIDGIGTNRLVVEGVERLGGAKHRVESDHIEIGSFLAAAAATGGELEVCDLPGGYTMTILERTFARLGVKWRRTEKGLVMSRWQKLVASDDMGGVLPKMEDGIWPAVPSDLMSVLLVLATQVKGGMLFFEKLFESRMYFVDWLIAMGADIVQCDPHRVVVRGPRKLHGGKITSPDIRAGMALIVAALCAGGESRIHRAEIIDRGYEKVDARLRALGADVTRLPDAPAAPQLEMK